MTPPDPPKEIWVTFDQDEPDCVWRSRESAHAWVTEMQALTPERGTRQVRRYIHSNAVISFAVTKWNEYVKHRPIENVHRRMLDWIYREMITEFGGDADALIGPREKP